MTQTNYFFSRPKHSELTENRVRFFPTENKKPQRAESARRTQPYVENLFCRFRCTGVMCALEDQVRRAHSPTQLLFYSIRIPKLSLSAADFSSSILFLWNAK